MKSNILVIIGALCVLGVLLYYIITTCESKKEGWVDYQQLPFGNVQSGAGDNTRPLSFYDYPIYRKPLDWPICNLVDYPVPHCRSNSL